MSFYPPTTLAVTVNAAVLPLSNQRAEKREAKEGLLKTLSFLTVPFVIRGRTVWASENLKTIFIALNWCLGAGYVIINSGDILFLLRQQMQLRKAMPQSFPDIR